MKLCLAKAVRVIIASLQLFSSEEWPDQLKLSSMQKMMPVVARVVNAVNIDIVTENLVSYKTFLSPLHAALQVVLAVPPSKLDRSLIYLLIQKFLPMFLLLVLKLLRKCWGRLTSDQQTELLKCAIARLSCTQDSDITSILCQLFIQLDSEEMSDSRSQLEFFVNYGLDHPNPIADQYPSVFQAFLYFIRREKPGADRNLEDSISAFAPALFRSVVERPDDRTQKVEPLCDWRAPLFSLSRSMRQCYCRSCGWRHRL
jgi:hypothetical protein